MKVQRILFGPILLALVGCTPMPDRISFAPKVPQASIQEIFVTSGRLPNTEPFDLQKDRTAKTRFVKYDISIPPTHRLGQVEWQKKNVNPLTDFAVTDLQDFGASDPFLRAIQAERGDDVTVYVHGYNNTPSEALYRFAQISQDFEISTARILFSWPSAGKPRGYVYDRDSVLFSRDAFTDVLTDIARKTDKEITLMAHSMGAHLTMEVLRQLAITGRRDVLDKLRVVALFAPDIDPDVFRRQANAIGKLPDPFVIMTNEDDRALSMSSFLNIGRQKVGNLNRAADVAGLNITLFDFTALEDGSNLDHLVPMTSPVAVRVLRDLVKSDRAGLIDLSDFDMGDDGIMRARAPDPVDPHLIASER